MLIENAAPRIGAIVTATDVRSLTEGDWKRLYQTWLDRHVLVVRGQRLSKPDFISYSRRFGRLKPPCPYRGESALSETITRHSRLCFDYVRSIPRASAGYDVHGAGLAALVERWRRRMLQVTDPARREVWWRGIERRQRAWLLLKAVAGTSSQG